MITISYEDAVVFRINDLSIITEKLNHYLNQPKKVKSISPDFIKIDIDPIVFKFVIIDLIKERKGIKTFCIQYDAEYYPDQIKVEKIGTYAETQSIKEKNTWRRIKNLFERKKPEMKIGRFGGEKLICPKGHELLTIVRWIS